MKFYTSVDRLGDFVMVRGYENGVRINKRVKFKPTYFIPSKEESEWRSLSGANVTPVQFESAKESRSFLERYKNLENYEICGNPIHQDQYIYEEYNEEVKSDMVRDTINVTTIDIEVKSDEGFPEPEFADHPIVSIVIKNNIDNVFYVWGTNEYLNDRKDVVYNQCENEVDLLRSFLNHWSRKDIMPDIVTGWNTTFFDIPYLVRRISKVLGEKKSKELSPWGYTIERTIKSKDRELITYLLYGIQQLDYLDLFKKFGTNMYGSQESYKLDHIAFVVLGEKKLSYEEHGTLHSLYKNDFQKFIDYNIRDVDLVDRMEDKLGLITLVMTMAYKAGVNFIDTLGTTHIWETIVYRYMMNIGVAPPIKKEKTKTPYPGAYIKEPHTGMHEWIVSFDVASMYPSVIVQWNMSPETIVNSFDSDISIEKCLDGYKSDQGFATAPNGAIFRTNEVGIFPQIVKSYYEERQTTKRLMIESEEKQQEEGTSYEIEKRIARYKNEQLAIKILMNSLYGAIGNQHFLYFDQRMAEATTYSSKLSIMWAEKHVNDAMNDVLETKGIDYIVAVNTDALYVCMKPIVDKFKPKNPLKFLSKISATHFMDVMNTSYDRLAKQLGCIENRMSMDREYIADRAVWTAKNRYILNVLDKEGVHYKEPKISVTGIEAIKSSTPQVVRGKFKDLFKVIMDGNEKKVQDTILEFREEFKSLPPEDASFPIGISEVEKWKDGNGHKKGCPIHVRGALNYNRFVEANGLDKKYAKVKSGDKIKLLHLKMPNPMRADVVAYPDVLPTESGMYGYVNYDTQFEKAFVTPIKSILDAIGWKVEETVSLMDFM